MIVTLRALATAALAEKLAAMTPEEKTEHDDPDGSKRRTAEEEHAHHHAWRMFKASPLHQWFPTVQWGVGDYPMYPPDSIVVYDTEDARNQHTNYFLIEWREHETHTGPELEITVKTTTMNHDSSTGYTYWSQGKPLRSAADVGEVFAARDETR